MKSFGFLGRHPMLTWLLLSHERGSEYRQVLILHVPTDNSTWQPLSQTSLRSVCSKVPELCADTYVALWHIQARVPLISSRVSG